MIFHREQVYFIRRATTCGLPVWWNYWDYCPRDEQDYYRHLNYSVFNIKELLDNLHERARHSVNLKR
ncbi:MAG: hypothetical protein DM484_24290 [Candidatus Methylumidiphilus alinenensis]|uniref:Uncharacterized protein n=1 Tax=Candidatus Methylumidiphilus alinenensis TaxID=2202197 RepID=A0A2W4SAJ6_9GAMM|nr:MAG: hypothetical protein DM484_24290 [Candidatus Methylumidiphilus alinenensis]